MELTGVITPPSFRELKDVTLLTEGLFSEQPLASLRPFGVRLFTSLNSL